ncbi:uncharacterized protein BDW47DRAFT_102597 [Aspergillus candidus]|uniref:Uncharacterized protein n=1 Tax=Aspergillus candidus TaxID=41067 RepID=A0A2I2FGW0_ASPCN|nr:hypothetical protein BDW47DRAFT_102597 [Aspergillus candidus]PLB39868.1 hypothetical protein BDW47DRAFT_102597 [Aspergillus candidus]
MDSRPGARAVFAGALIIVLAMASIVYLQLDLTQIDLSACDLTLPREESWSVMKLVNRVLGAFVEVNSYMHCQSRVPSPPPSSFPGFFDESLDGVWSEA